MPAEGLGSVDSSVFVIYKLCTSLSLAFENYGWNVSPYNIDRYECKERQFPSLFPDLFMNAQSSDCDFANLPCIV
jgi:hypothetical protein